MIKTILTLILVPGIAVANCDIPTAVKKGEASPCDGYVISRATEERIRIDLVHKDKLIENLTKIGTAQENIIKIDNEQIKIYEDKLRHEQNFNSWQKAFYFGLGAVLTGAVAYGAVQVVR